MSPVRYSGGGGEAAAPGGSNFTPSVKPAVAISTLLTAPDLARVSPAMAVAPVATLLETINTGCALSTQNQGTIKPAVNPALQMRSILTVSDLAKLASGFDLTQVTFDLIHRRGAGGHTAAGSAWTNPANAYNGTDGLHNSSSATRAGSAAGAIDGTLTLSYPAQADRGSLTITAVKLYFYVAQAGTVLDDGGLDLSYNLGGTDTLLATFTGNTASLVTPLEYDITAAVAGSWANIAALRTKVRFHVALGAALVNASLDAVEVEVVAGHTMTN